MKTWHGNAVQRAKSQFENWHLALPVLSFNMAKYENNDMNLKQF